MSAADCRRSPARAGVCCLMIHLTETGAVVIHAKAAAPEPVNGRWNLRGRTGEAERHERGGRVHCTALHARVPQPRRCRMRRWARSLTCSFVEMSERRAGEGTKGQARCRSQREDPLPHRLAPSVNDIHCSSQYHIGSVSTPRARLQRLHRCVCPGRCSPRCPLGARDDASALEGPAIGSTKRENPPKRVFPNVCYALRVRSQTPRRRRRR
jgi:hypothetical protein